MKHKRSPGEEVGSWTLLRYLTKNNRGYWECECKCGEIFLVEVASLNRGRSQSCRACAMKSTRDTRIVPAHYWLKLNRHAEKRGHVVHVTHQYAEQLLEQQCHRCALTGWEIGFGRGRRKNGQHSDGETTASLDRVEPSLHYTAGNIQWVHKDVNRMKQAFSESRLLELCIAVISFHKDANHVGSAKVFDEHVDC